MGLRETWGEGPEWFGGGGAGGGAFCLPEGGSSEAGAGKCWTATIIHIHHEIDLRARIGEPGRHELKLKTYYNSFECRSLSGVAVFLRRDTTLVN